MSDKTISEDGSLASYWQVGRWLGLPYLPLAFGEFWAGEVPGTGMDSERPSLALFLAFLASEAEKGHICVRTEEEELVPGLRKFLTPRRAPATARDRELAQEAAALEEGLVRNWRRFTAIDALFATGRDRTDRPFLFREERFIYLRRLYLAEKTLLDRLDHLSGPPPLELSGGPHPAPNPLAGKLNELQKKAVETFGRHRLFILIGGPGTGKTTAAAAMVQSWLDSTAPGSGARRLVLAAPTGLAAKRLAETPAMKAVLSAWEADGRLEVQSATIHRLLSSGALSGDLFIVDEASMIDLDLMNALLGGLPPRAGLILLGDDRQLPSIDTGALLGDLTDGHEDPRHRLHGAVVRLTETHRFPQAVRDLAALIVAGQGDSVAARLSSGSGRDWQWFDPAALYGRVNELALRWREEIRDWKTENQSWRELLDEPSPSRLERAFETLGRRFILSPLREGPWGTLTLERLFENVLAPERRGAFYHGKPVLVTRNSYESGLFNGDRGLVLAMSDGLWAVFVDASSEGRGGFRRFPVAALPDHESSFVMTIHKSQGSEAPEVIVVIPEEGELSTRELLYTAVTRTRGKLSLFATEAALRRTVERQVTRNSGLREALLRPKPRSLL